MIIIESSSSIFMYWRKKFSKHRQKHLDWWLRCVLCHRITTASAPAATATNFHRTCSDSYTAQSRSRHTIHTVWCAHNMRARQAWKRPILTESLVLCVQTMWMILFIHVSGIRKLKFYLYHSFESSSNSRFISIECVSIFYVVISM